ncbi:hypothetical protein [Carboxylicivirga marina]|nr:hypothetical protein [uncultured Carboxylicivirga sp.]
MHDRAKRVFWISGLMHLRARLVFSKSEGMHVRAWLLVKRLLNPQYALAYLLRNETTANQGVN